MRYRIALCGFSEFEYRAIHFTLENPPGFLESEFDLVGALSDADFAVVDADSLPAVKGVVQSGREPQAVFIGSNAPPGAAVHLARPIDTMRIVQALDELGNARTTPAAFHETPLARKFPTLEEVVEEEATIDVELPEPPPASEVDIYLEPSMDTPIYAEADLHPEGWVPAPPPPPRAKRRSHAPPPPPPADRASARAAARHRRLVAAQASREALPPLRDVLVLDADRVANAQLCGLLEIFGFKPRAVHSLAEANAKLMPGPWAALFLDITLDDSGLALMERIRQLPKRLPNPDPAVLLVSAHLAPTDRVRAALAGLDAPLIKPLSRGDVARALDARNVVLPEDARQL